MNNNKQVVNVKLNSYQRTSEKLLNHQIKPKVFAMFENGRLHIGTQSLHRTAQSRVWRLFWRLKQQRNIGMTIKNVV